VITNGNFVGTSSFGSLWGSIYQLSPSGSMQVLHAFFGVASWGGDNSDGTVFKLKVRQKE
jgi:hypothetical protein